jgi:hypothetical protein
MTDPAIATSTPAAAPASPATAAPLSPSASPRPGAIADAHYDNLPPDEQGKYSRVRKGPDGGSEWRERATLPSETAPAANPDGSVAAKPGDAPSVTADGKLKVGEFELSAADISNLMQERASRDLRASQIPSDPTQYQSTLPADFKMPDGVAFQFNTADPAFVDARTWAHSQGFTQEQFSRLLSFHVAGEAAKEATFRASMKVELDKLGANATVRVTALQTWLRGMVGDDLAKSMAGGMFSEKQVRGLELLANKFSSQGAASFRQDGREPDAPRGRASEAEYNAMTSAERYAYSKAFDQKQFQGR